MAEKTLTLAGAGAEPPMRTLLEAWLDHPTTELAPLTVRRYRGAVMHFPVWYARVDDTDGDVQQPSAYPGDDSCKAISDERNGPRNSAKSATVAVPTTSPSVSQVCMTH